jgi:trans-2,3-dihydro-3-hydroxyanthranilate isomerase
VGRASVDKATPDPRLLTALVARFGGEGCYVHSTEPADPIGSVAYARFFNPEMGISEDPATGTAAGTPGRPPGGGGSCPEGTTAVIEQGHAVQRPSRIRVTVTGDRVAINGSGLVVADGTLHL